MGIFDFLKPRKPECSGPTDIVLHNDFEAAEEIRGKLTKAQIGELRSLYPSLGDWSLKDLVIHMLQDTDAEPIKGILSDGMNSPTLETQAVCLCLLHPEKIKFEDLLDDGKVSQTRVQQARDDT